MIIVLQNDVSDIESSHGSSPICCNTNSTDHQMKTMSRTKSNDHIDYEGLSDKKEIEEARLLTEKVRERHSYKSSSSSVTSYHHLTAQEGYTKHNKECSGEKEKWKFNSHRSELQTFKTL